MHDDNLEYLKVLCINLIICGRDSQIQQENLWWRQAVVSSDGTGILQ